MSYDVGNEEILPDERISALRSARVHGEILKFNGKLEGGEAGGDSRG